MAAQKKSSDFENRFFDLLEGTISGIDTKVDRLADSIEANTKAIGKIAARVDKIESKVFPKPVETMQQLPPIWRDPQIIKLVTYVVIFGIIVAVIVAGLKGLSLPKGIL